MKRSPHSRRRIRRRRTGAAALILALVCLGTLAVAGGFSLVQDAPPGSVLSLDRNEEPNPVVATGDSPSGAAGGEASPESGDAAERGTSGNDEPPATGTPASAAYASLISGVPGASAGDLVFVQRSVIEPSGAAVWFAAPERGGRERYYVFFTERVSEGEWRVVRSVVAGDHEFTRDLETMIPNLPDDLKTPVLRTSQDTSEPAPSTPSTTDDPRSAATGMMDAVTGGSGWSAGEAEESGDFYRVPVRRDSPDGEQSTQVFLRAAGDGTLAAAGIGTNLTSAELPGFPASLAPEAELPEVAEVSFDPTTPVYDGGAKEDVEQRGIEAAVSDVEDYPGVAGFYAMNPEDGSGYGVRPDEEFFSASTIKVAVMAAVYRKIDEGEISYEDTLTTTGEDWAAGAGWLRWNTPGANTTVEDALWLMMTESDNVATNVLLRTAGGPEYVNTVIADLGATDTELFWKLSSERAATPSLDNHTTPRDMATMLSGIYAGEGFEDFSRDEMVDLMTQNNLEYWLEGGIPNGTLVANKGGWQDGIYNDVGIVRREGSPYVIAIYTMNGPGLNAGSPVLSEISKAVWLAQTGETKEESERQTESRSAQQDSGDSQGR